MPNPQPRLSRADVNRAGEILANPESALSRTRWATGILGEWRTLHNLPLEAVFALVHEKVQALQPDALVVNRRKREVSIAAKLQRSKGMQLARMQDLGGVRAVVRDLPTLRALEAALTAADFPHPVTRPYDYIKDPKESGYRSLHLVHRSHHPQVPESDGLLVEVQLRTENQHAWATALETVDAFRQSSLKSSKGPDDWQDFFRLAGAAFAHLENSPVNPQFAGRPARDIFAETVREADALWVPQKLRSYARIVRDINGAGGSNTSFLLELDIDRSAVNYRSFSPEQADFANAEYLVAESRAKQSGALVVLVAAESPEKLREAYPNYFMETDRFVALLDEVRRRAAA